MDPATDQTTQGGPASQAGAWINAGAAAASGEQGAQADQAQALKAAQHPDPSNQPQTTTPTSNAQFSPVPVGGPPLVMRPKRGGFLGVIDKMADAMTGTTRPEIYADQDGNEYVYHPNLSRGQQWARIGGDLARGAAAGYAAGRGAGGEGRAALAGFQVADQRHQADQQQETQMDEKAQREMMQRANRTMVQMQIAEQGWRFGRMQTVANQEDEAFGEKTVDFYTKTMGGTLLGVAAHPGDIGDILKVNPSTMEDLVKRHVIELVSLPGKGVAAVKMPENSQNKMLPPGTEFPTWDPLNHKVVTNTSTDGMRLGEWSNYVGLAAAARDKYNADQAELEKKQQETKNIKGEISAREQKTPVEIEKDRAAAAESRAAASKAPSEIAKNEAEAAKATAESASDPATVDAIGQGRMNVGRMAYLLARNPALANAVTAKYPDFDTTKPEAYLKIREDFTSGKTSTQINGGATAMKHLQELLHLNTVKSRIPGTADYNAYENKADTVSTELARFYGTETIPGIAEIKKTLAATFNRESAIRTQATSMVDKLGSFEQQWRNAAPSPAYHTPMPGIDLQAKEALAELSPDYAKKLTVKMKAPNGDVTDVPFLDMSHYMQKGATVVDQ
jgi:hypothetical protein